MDKKELEAGTLDDDISQIEYRSDLDQFNIPIEDAIVCILRPRISEIPYL